MSHTVPQDFKSEDSLSDVSTNSERAPLKDANENGVPAKTRKIRKERKAYHKIDDNIRLLLLEATRNGETLKSAAKRFQVNYSSAKSIFYTFRKEGRILKKINQERGPNYGSPVGQSGANGGASFIPTLNLPSLSPGSLGNQVQKSLAPLNFNGMEQKVLQNMREQEASLQIPKLSESPNDVSLSYLQNLEAMMKKDTQAQNPYLYSNMEANLTKGNPQMQFNLNQLAGLGQENPLAQLNLALKSGLMGSLASNAQLLQNMTNVNKGYLNATAVNSDLEASNTVKEEFDTLQGTAQKLMEYDQLLKNNKKGVSFIPELTSHEMSAFATKENQLQKLIMNENADLSSDIQNMALDAYKSFVDAQMYLSNALNKASYLNNLVQIQQIRGGRPLDVRNTKII